MASPVTSPWVDLMVQSGEDKVQQEDAGVKPLAPDQWTVDQLNALHYFPPRLPKHLRNANNIDTDFPESRAQNSTWHAQLVRSRGHALPGNI